MSDDYGVGLQAVAETTGQFANQFLKTVADTPRNLITSPLSAQVVLAMTAYGARSTTAEEMRAALFVPSDDELGHSGYQSLIETLNAQKGVELLIANRIYASIKAAVNPEFKKLTATRFLSSSEEVDFDDAEGSASIINSWCEEQTNKRIKDLVTSDCITPETLMVLVNAVYFKGQWEKKFDPDLTEDRLFHVNGTDATDLPTMFVKNTLRFKDIEDLDARLLEVPYEGGEVSMLIVVPNEIDGLGTIKENLHKLNLGECLQTSRCEEVELFLPKFKIESTLDLKEPLQNLGMIELFENNADFSGISEIPLKVSKVIQKAFIEVNEEGSEAAAATAVLMTLRCAFPEPTDPVIFKIDRPFYYAIHHLNTNIPLFTGFVYKPEVA